jgi:glucose-6-phosphate 1-epimerase
MKDMIDASGVARLQEVPGGLQKLVIDAPAAGAEIFLHGAHVAHFQPRGHRPVLFLSRKSLFRPDKPIRGGVPICFPWFGPKADDSAAPMHGFARFSQWNLESIERVGDGARVALSLHSNEATRKYWPHDFAARFTATFADVLDMTLRVTNTGRSPIVFQEALHTYLAVSDVRNVTLRGLENTRYLDKVAGGEGVESPQPMRFTGETDRVYPDTTARCVVDDPGLKRKITIEKSGSNATVVWNPWIERAKALPDFGDDEWPAMLCVETANTTDCAVTLKPRESHTIRAILRVD